MIKVFLPLHITSATTLFLELNSKFEFVGNSDEADIIIINSHIYLEENSRKQLEEIVKPHHVLVNLEIFHIDHYMSIDWIRDCVHKPIVSNLTKKIITVHTNMNINDGYNTIFYDHLFDRQKLYCTDYDSGIILSGRVWTHGCNKEIYSLNPIKKIPFKKFLAPMRVYKVSPNQQKEPPRMEYRRKIKNFLSKTDDSFISASNQSNSFLPNAATPDMITYVSQGGSWYPISDVYYSTSLINVYTETLVVDENNNNVRGVTEKSYDPLIKGNFILPFGYPGLIKDILSYGFKLPAWIDYSYDSILDNNKRFEAYMESLNTLNNYSLTELFDLAMQDWKILEHNRSIFYARTYSYPLLADKIKLCIEHNNSNNWMY